MSTIEKGERGKLEEVLMDWRTLAVIAVVTILWRIFISLDKRISFRESVCSGVVLLILGWFIFGYLYRLSKRDTSWLISNKLAKGLAISAGALDIYALIYYGMRWYGFIMGPEEVYIALDYLLWDVRYAMLVLAYGGLIWATGYLRKMHDNYMLVTKDMPERRIAGVNEALFRVITDERTVIVILGVVFLWRAFISFDKKLDLWECMCSGIGMFILGWVLFGYISSLAVRTTRPSVAKIYQGYAFALFAVNMYVLVYYAIRWYTLIYAVPPAGEALVPVPLNFVFMDISYFMWAIFYCTAIVLSKYLERASMECEFLIKKGMEG
ncbi:MAG: hypothetical protein WAV32_02265 [Halobacteriota archaeon]